MFAKHLRTHPLIIRGLRLVKVVFLNLKDSSTKMRSAQTCFPKTTLLKIINNVSVININHPWDKIKQLKRIVNVDCMDRHTGGRIK